MKKSMLKRTVLAVATAAALVLTACNSGDGGGQSGEQAGPTTLKFYNDKAGWKDAFVEVGTASKSATQIGISPVGYSDANAYSAFIRNSFRTKEKPDLFTWHTGKELQDLVENDLVAETDAAWQQAIKDGNVAADLQQYFQIDGKTYCVPLNAGYWVIYYKKSIFDEVGISEPTSWEEVEANAAKLKKAGITPYYQTNVLFSFVWFETLLANRYPDVYQGLSDGSRKYTDPEVVETMNTWKTMMEAGYFSDPGSKTEPAQQLKSGDVAMVNLGTWFSGNLNTLEMKPGTDYDFFVIPKIDPGLAKTPVIVEAGPVCSAKESANAGAVEKWTDWWFTPEAQTTWANSRGDLSFNPKADVADESLAELNTEMGSGDYQLLNRYFEATPTPVLNKALEVFGEFTTKPGDPMPGLQKIQAEADAYWADQ
jgi:ABC-type glycerol-3-phosphate transport system substrate-binding protein